MYPNLKAELARLDITYSKLAGIMKIPKSGITDRMNGTTDWRKKEIDVAIKLTKKTYEYLFATCEARKSN